MGGYLSAECDEVLPGDDGEPLLLEVWSCRDARVGIQLAYAGHYSVVAEIRQEGVGDRVRDNFGLIWARTVRSRKAVRR